MAATAAERWMVERSPAAMSMSRREKRREAAKIEPAVPIVPVEPRPPPSAAALAPTVMRALIPALVQTVNKIRCPACRSDRVNCEGRKESIRYYRCLVCVDFETSSWTTFKVSVVDPLGPAPAS